MKRLYLLVIAAGLGATLACGNGSPEGQTGVEDQIQDEVEAAKQDAGSGDGPVAGAPQVSDTYQSSINRGWEEAVAGDTPAYACAGLKGQVMGTEETADPEALEALFACNVLLPVRYFETYLERVESGEKSCYEFSTEMSIQLPAMTLSVDSIQGMVDAMEEGGEEAAAGSLAGAVDDATMEQGLTDPKRLIKDRLEEPLRRLCPDMAGGILR